MKIETLDIMDKNGQRENYFETGSYEGIITDEETGKAYKLRGNDWNGKKDRFYFAQADTIEITELEADGVTDKKDGLLIQGTHYHEHSIKHGRGIDAYWETLEDHVTVRPMGENSEVGYYLGGGFGRFNGSYKGIVVSEEASDSLLTDEQSATYKMQYQEKYAPLIKGLMKASQEIRRDTIARDTNTENKLAKVRNKLAKKVDNVLGTNLEEMKIAKPLKKIEKAISDKLFGKVKE